MEAKQKTKLVAKSYWAEPASIERASRLSGALSANTGLRVSRDDINRAAIRIGLDSLEITHEATLKSFDILVAKESRAAKKGAGK